MTLSNQNPTTSFPKALRDPLSINLRKQTELLLTHIPTSSGHHVKITSASNPPELLAALSNALAAPAFTKIITKFFRPLLLDLCARWIHESYEATEQYLVALCYLVEVHEEIFPVLNHILHKHFEEGPLAFLIDETSVESIDVIRLQRLLLAYYRILQANRELPYHSNWPLAPLSKLMWTPGLHNGVRLLAIRCYSLQSRMGEAERLKVEAEVLGEPCGVDCQLNFGQDLNGMEVETDGWILPVIEVERIQKERNEMVTDSIDFYNQEGGDSTFCLEECHLSPFIANVHGVLLLRSSITPQSLSTLVPTPSSTEVIQQLALNFSLRLPTLLTSNPSAGKTLLISHLATLLHPGKQNHVVTIHLADTSLDPRSLFGSYVSSTVYPGTFEWKEGVLVRSMREGKWVVLKDVDRGSAEVLSVLKPLVESLELGKWIGGRARMTVPSRGTVVAHDEFRLFGTRSTSPSRDGTFYTPTFYGSHKFFEIIVASPSPEELSSIIDAKFPRLAGNIAGALIRMWDAIRAFGSPSTGREFGLRDLEKFCRRVDGLLPTQRSMDISMEDGREILMSDIFPHPEIREEMYLEARDVYFGFGASTSSTQAHVAALSRLIGEHLGMDAERQDWVLRQKAPLFEIEKNANGQVVSIKARRLRLLAHRTKISLQRASSRPFAMHKPAVFLMSKLVAAVSHCEPVLLTGETGTGKTSVITHMADLLNQRLISLNLSHQTESSDLVGGLKPIDARGPGAALQEKFVGLFGATFSRRKNEKFETEVRKAVNECKWKRAVGLWKESVRMAMERLQAKQSQEDSARMVDDGTPRKRRKTENDMQSLASSWSDLLHEVEAFETQHVLGKGKFAFGFVEGPLVKALRFGYWVLLDEVNLASPETLECLSSLLQGPTASITLTEHGSLEPVTRHPNFRLFACMNPATDVGKKDLPPTIRARFTEIDVPSPDTDKETLLTIITQYIGHVAVGDKTIIMDIAEFYLAVKRIAEQRHIADGANHRPHFSIRTLARALTFASDIAPTFGLRRAVWEGSLMAFTMILDGESAQIVANLAKKHLLSAVRNLQSMLSKEPPPQSSSVKFGPFYLEQGPLPEDLAEDYIITPSVAQKLVDLSRIILTRRFPVLIEGPTSSGKTSSIEYLAKRTGHRFVRINNHEHTDIQEYIGSYVSDPVTGKLVFKDGLLVQALREGHWIVLDELNLAPTDVLEALNRLLDDNRELVIPETQEVVRPHSHFLLFATQNPPGLYGGRKVLSRAFRNRFLEVHFDDVPQIELETILCQRCRIAPSYGKKIVHVFRELQKRRQSGRVFESKQGFATLRDLFRWAGRDVIHNGYQELAENGYMLLAERVRREADKAVVKEVIEQEMGVRIDINGIYDFHQSKLDLTSFLGVAPPPSSPMVWTKAMRRLFVLVSRALKFNEPVLLVGETGCGKTSVCQLFAQATSQRLVTLNCHQNTETADVIGGLRPIRNRVGLNAEAIKDAISILDEAGIPYDAAMPDLLTAALDATMRDRTLDPQVRARVEDMIVRLSRSNAIFDWHDGPLVDAMQHGHVFLMDEISLADDSVLERLNSVLEPGRSIVLAEQGGIIADNPSITAAPDFKLLATMNPGGDFGKKELSPALRNRFTEIWVPSVNIRGDLEMIINDSWCLVELRAYTSHLLDFVDWLGSRLQDHTFASLRDVLAWIYFTNCVLEMPETRCVSTDELFHHAAHMTFLDGLSSLPQLSGLSREAIDGIKQDGLKKLQDLVPLADPMDTNVLRYDESKFVQLGSFAIARGPSPPIQQSFNFDAPTTLDNAKRVIRSCQVAKPILLEGSPGVGKTSLITALANLSGHHLCRINLSDQTDLIDLFGSDLPVEGGVPGEFAWKDAEFLQALQRGHWVLLDEMNLAPQAVLEGLNAILDHRGTVYIPELNRSFQRHPSFRIFAAQNPLYQGGGRKGLPKSFVNRFSKVYLDELTPKDLLVVCTHLFRNIEDNTLRSMISFNIKLNEEATAHRTFAQDGSPWEFNLRDVLRWATLSANFTGLLHPTDFLRPIYLHRLRTEQDRQQALTIFTQAFSANQTYTAKFPTWFISPGSIHFGSSITPRRNHASLLPPRRILKSRTSILEALGFGLAESWPVILTGSRNTGKTSLVRVLASVTGNPLYEIEINQATDTMDILGSFEQVDSQRRLSHLMDQLMKRIELEQSSLHGSQGVTMDYAHFRRLRAECEGVRPISELAERALALASTIPAASPTAAEALQFFTTSVQDILHSSLSTGQFQWVDGPLVSAMLSGGWVLLNGANLCNPSVLDRLNSLCEADGTLTLSERGFVNGKAVVLKPHRDFRLFMTVDPHYGELSRAMRNRGLEIFTPQILLEADEAIIQDAQRLPPVVPQDSISLGSRFEAVRRGLLLRGQPTSLAASTSFDEDSAVVWLRHGFLHLFKTFPDLDCPAAWIHVLSRMSVPRFVPHLRRYVEEMSHPIQPQFRQFLATYPNSQVDHALVHLRQDFALRENMPVALTFYLPMYFHLAASQSDVPASDLSTSQVDSASSGVLNTLALSVELFLAQPLLEKIPKGRELSQANGRIITAATELTDSVYTMAISWMESPNTTDVTSIVISTLLSYSVYLRRALTSYPYDYSTLCAILEWFQDALDPAVHISTRPLELARILQQEVSPSRGLGLLNLWSQLYPGQPNAASMELAAWTDQIASSLKKASRLRRQAFNIVSLETFSNAAQTRKEDANDVLSLRSRLNELLPTGDSVKQPTTYQTDFATCLLGLELLIISHQETTVRSMTIMEEMVKIMSEAQLISLVQILPYQHLIWSAGTESLAEAVKVRAQISWMEGLWNTCLANGISGPAILPKPVLFHRTFEICDIHNVPVSSIAEQEDLIRNQARTLLVIGQNKLSRLGQLVQLLLKTFGQIAKFHSASFDAPTLSAFQEIDYKDGDCISTPIFMALSLLQKSSEQHLKTAADDLETFLMARPTQSIHYLCPVAWIGLGILFLQQCIPNTPVDPSAIQAAKLRRLQDQAQCISAQVQLHDSLEEVLTGNSTNEIAIALRMRLQEIESQSSKMSDLPRRNDAARLHTFWAEAQHFQKAVLDPSRLGSVIDDFFRFEQDASQRERVVQESLSTFYQRLDTIYADFADLNILLKFGIGQIRLGLGLLAENWHVQQEAASQQSEGMAIFPLISHASNIIFNFKQVEPSSSSVFRHILAALNAATLEFDLDCRNTQIIATIELANQQAVRLWLVDRTRAKQSALDSSSLYRHNQSDYNMVSDAQLEENEFLTMFPTFEDAFERSSRTTPHESEGLPPLTFVGPADVKAMLHAHLDLVDPHSHGYYYSSACQRLQKLESDGIRRSLWESLSSSPGSLDQTGVPIQIVILHSARAALSSNRDSALSYNFYADPNYGEAKHAASVLYALRERLESISKEWPEQMVLRHLTDKCDTVLSSEADAPIAKLLTMVEQLLIQTDDWETYANRVNSIKHEREELIGLVVRWRRLELACWQSLLDSQATAFAEEDGDWWFRLYDGVIRVPLSFAIDGATPPEESLRAYLATLVPLLDDFIGNSSLGQFATRLRLLQSFVRYAAIIIPSKAPLEQSILRRIISILQSTWASYDLFSASLQRHLTKQKGTLEKEVMAFIKLASWKDVNVHALQQSARRTHHQLYKVVRRFRELLKQPIRSHLRLEDVHDAQISSLKDASNSDSLISDGHESQLDGLVLSHHKTHLTNPTRTLSRFSALSATRIIPFIRLSHAERIDEVAGTVIATSLALAGLEIPSALPSEQQERFAKSLLVRKRKAWSDLLKELKFSGLTSNPKPELLRRHVDPLWIAEQPVLPSLEQFDFAPGETYFTKLRMTLPRLRVALPSHHSDLTTRELTRGEGFLETSFSLAIDLRSRLATALEAFNRINNAEKRIKSLVAADFLVVISRPKLKALVATLGRYAHSLSELQHHLSALNTLEIELRVSDELTREVEEAAGATIRLHESCRMVLENVNLSVCDYLTHEDFEITSAGLKSISDSAVLLLSWLEKYPALGYLLEPLHLWMSTQPMPSVTEPRVAGDPDISTIEALLEMLLVCVQTLAGKCPEETDRGSFPTDTTNSRYIVQGYTLACDLTSALNLGNVASQLEDILAVLPSWPNGGGFLQPILSFTNAYTNIAREQIMILNNWTRALFKLDFVLCNLLLTLCERGFCKPPEGGTAESGADSGDANGVGIGEGIGTENISQEIEDESQVEGLRGDETRSEGRANGEEGDALEMDQDFGGELEDILDPGDDANEEDLGDDQEDVEEALGNLDSQDPAAVDEKLWGDERGPEDKLADENKACDDHSTEQTGPTDVVAKENQQRETQRKADDESQVDTAETEQQTNLPDEQQEGNADQGQTGGPLEEYIQNADTRNLPDDMNLNDDEKVDIDNAKEDKVELSDDSKDESDTGEGSEVGDAQQDSMRVMNGDNEGLGEDNGLELDTEIVGVEGEEAEHEEQPPPVTAEPDLSQGHGAPDTKHSTTQEPGECKDDSGAADFPTEGVGHDSAEENVNPNENMSVDTKINSNVKDNATKGSAYGASSAQSGQTKPEEPFIEVLPNPLRSVGDTLKHVRQQFDEILQSRETDKSDERANELDPPSQSQLEYLRPEDQDYDMQALGPAGDEQIARLDQLKIIDDTLRAEDQVAPMMLDEPWTNADPNRYKEDVSRSLEGVTTADGRDPNDGALTRTKTLDDDAIGTPEFAWDGDPLDNIVETELRTWRLANYPEGGAERIWRLYETLTNDLAYALCEQLRLILQPTLATRLKGDYRSGKRLNMKKVIAYIASDYTKDKIWLRRTKPSQREYQVLISIDDSRSMAESHSIHLAYQTLALISKALTKLESGDIAIAKFGESVDILRRFEDGLFSEHAGARMVNAFRFDQKATNVLALIETSLRFLKGARERKTMSSTTAADLWQLQIIVSDGMCQDHDKIRRLLRKAEEQRVMIVFIILDSRQTQSTSITSELGTKGHSILEMEKVDFKIVHGKTELVQQKYLDSFPFEYYVVLRDVEALPEVLSETLKQFFERVSED